MLLALAALLFILWILGFGFFFSAVGGLIHVVLVIAVVLVLFHFFTGSRSAV